MNPVPPSERPGYRLRPARHTGPRARGIRGLVAGSVAIALACASIAPVHGGEPPAEARKGARPALTVETVVAERASLRERITLSGNVAPWQEAVIGAEIAGLRLAEIHAEVGDQVAAGALLARFATDTVEAELALARASLAEAEAAVAEARVNAERARQVQASGALSAQQVGQLLTAEMTAQARVEAARAQVRAQEVRLRHAQVIAPDAGVISARNATLGAVAQPGAELFRMIRRARLEWRAEVPSASLHRLRAGQVVQVQAPSGAVIEGRIRRIAPTVDAASRNAIAHVDLPASAAPALRAGMFVRGELDLGTVGALTLPQSAVLLREGLSYAFRVEADGRVAQVRIETGRRDAGRVEVVSGLAEGVVVVRSGVAFLSDGDRVRLAPATR